MKVTVLTLQLDSHGFEDDVDQSIACLVRLGLKLELRVIIRLGLILGLGLY